jgi:hypothetical protein
MVGDWSGTHSTANEEQSGAMSLRVTMTRNGVLYGTLNVSGPVEFEFTARVNYDAKTQRFTYFVVTPKLAVRFEGHVTSGANGLQMDGTLSAFTRKGAYKATYSAFQAG